MSEYTSPSDEYVRSPSRVSVLDLAIKWHSEQRDGYSYGTLKKRCAEEDWVRLRLEFQRRLREETMQASMRKEVQIAGEAAEDVRERYIGIVERVIGGAVRYLKRYEPTAEDVDNVPPYRSPREAVGVLLKAIEHGIKIRGLDQFRAEPVYMLRYEELLIKHGIRCPGVCSDRPHEPTSEAA
jgi:hypothetical protein